MATPTTVCRSGLVAAPPETVFEAALSLPLPRLYSRRYGPLPPIVDVREQEGEWTTPGQTRVLVTADGGRMREEMLTLERPDRFSNRLTVLAGPFRPLVATVDEAWSFRPLGTGTEATWEWQLYARSVATQPLMPVVARLWRGYARRVLERLAAEVHGTAAD